MLIIACGASIGGGRVDVVNDDDGDRLFFGNELEAGLFCRGEEGGAEFVLTRLLLRWRGHPGKALAGRCSVMS